MMPHATIRTGVLAPNGQEEVISDFLCDWPDCPNVAEHVAGVARELRRVLMLCPEHAAALHCRAGQADKAT
jgi:hypothetical protein